MPALVFHAVPGFDSLTGLPDRAAFLAALRSAASSGEGVAVLFLDLDDFKVDNDGFGHEAGDRLLIQVAERLKTAVRGEDLVARLGGDEFTVLCCGLEDPSQATITAGRIRAALSAPFDVAGQRRHVRVSIGCRVAAADEADPEALLRDADSAMYQAKGAGNRSAPGCSAPPRATRDLARAGPDAADGHRQRVHASSRTRTSRSSSRPHWRRPTSRRSACASS